MLQLTAFTQFAQLTSMPFLSGSFPYLFCFLDFMCKWNHTCIYLCPAYLVWHNTWKVHPHCPKWPDFYFLGLSNMPLQRRQWHPTPVLLPGKPHGWRSLVGCSPWGCKESGATEWLHFHFSLSCIGEGNGNPLQYSCLENPRDWGVWWAAVYGIAQRLKWFSISSSSSSSMTLCVCVCVCVCVYTYISHHYPLIHQWTWRYLSHLGQCK